MWKYPNTGPRSLRISWRKNISVKQGFHSLMAAWAGKPLSKRLHTVWPTAGAVGEKNTGTLLLQMMHKCFMMSWHIVLCTKAARLTHRNGSIPVYSAVTALMVKRRGIIM